jgi:hypothetical protein
MEVNRSVRMSLRPERRTQNSFLKSILIFAILTKKESQHDGCDSFYRYMVALSILLIVGCFSLLPFFRNMENNTTFLFRR